MTNPTEFQTGQIRAVECYKEGWELIKDDYWLLFAISLVGGLIGGMSMYILLGAMVCGIFVCFLQKIDTGKVEFDSLWKGFGFFVPSLVVTIFVVIPIMFVYGVIYAPLIMAAVLGQNLDPGAMISILLAGLAVDLVFVVLMVCFHTLIMFAYPLIADRNLPAIQAMTTSAKAVWANLGGVAALFGIQFLAVFVGALLTCGLGIYFLMPIMLAGMAVGYRRVFPSLTRSEFSPPPPTAYPGAGAYQQ